MEKRIILSLSIVTALTLFLVACSKKTEETAEQPAETTTAPQPTPIDQSTVGEVTGKVSFGEQNRSPTGS